MTLRLQYICESSIHIPVYLPTYCPKERLAPVVTYALIQQIVMEHLSYAMDWTKHWDPVDRSPCSPGASILMEFTWLVIIFHLCVSWLLWNYWKIEKGFHFPLSGEVSKPFQTLVYFVYYLGKLLPIQLPERTLEKSPDPHVHQCTELRMPPSLSWGLLTPVLSPENPQPVIIHTGMPLPQAPSNLPVSWPLLQNDCLLEHLVGYQWDLFL